MVGTMAVRSQGHRGRAALVTVVSDIALAVRGRVASMVPPKVARASIHLRVANTAVPVSMEHPADMGADMGSTSIIRDMATATAGVVRSMAMATNTAGTATGMVRTWAKVLVAGRGRSSLVIRVSPHTLAVKARRIHVSSRTVVSARTTSAHRTVAGNGAKAHNISARHTGAAIRAKARSISGIRGSGTTSRMVAVVPPPCTARVCPLLLPTSRVALSAAPKVDVQSIKPSVAPCGIGLCKVASICR